MNPPDAQLVRNIDDDEPDGAVIVGKLEMVDRPHDPLKEDDLVFKALDVRGSLLQHGLVFKALAWCSCFAASTRTSTRSGTRSSASRCCC